MNEYHLYLLLLITLKNKGLSQLTRQKVTYREISDLIDGARSLDYLEMGNQTLILTKKGTDKFLELEKKYKKTNKETWIEKATEFMIPKVDRDFIYLPNQNELFF